MAKMTIGSYSLPHNPSSMDLIKPQRSCASQETHGGIAFFSWGTMVNGQVTTLVWPFMAASTFASLDALYCADVPYVLDPQDGTTRTFNIEILDFNGEYHRGLGETPNVKRTNVRMTILILSRAS